jgi:hypothetical protein
MGVAETERTDRTFGFSYGIRICQHLGIPSERLQPRWWLRATTGIPRRRLSPRWWFRIPTVMVLDAAYGEGPDVQSVGPFEITRTR